MLNPQSTTGFLFKHPLQFALLNFHIFFQPSATVAIPVMFFGSNQPTVAIPVMFFGSNQVPARWPGEWGCLAGTLWGVPKHMGAMGHGCGQSDPPTAVQLGLVCDQQLDKAWDRLHAHSLSRRRARKKTWSTSSNQVKPQLPTASQVAPAKLRDEQTEYFNFFSPVVMSFPARHPHNFMGLKKANARM